LNEVRTPNSLTNTRAEKEATEIKRNVNFEIAERNALIAEQAREQAERDLAQAKETTRRLEEEKAIQAKDAILKAAEEEARATATLKQKEEEEAKAKELLEEAEEEEEEAEEAEEEVEEEAEEAKEADEIPSIFNNKMEPEKTESGISIPDIQTPIYYPNFYQPQMTGAGCGRFALNNLLHCERFTFTYPSDEKYKTTMSIEEANTIFENFSLDKQTNLSDVCELNNLFYLADTKVGKDPALVCRSDEDFPTDVITTALLIIGHPTEIVRQKDGDIPNSTDNDILGYILNLGNLSSTSIVGKGRHYVALRKILQGSNAGKFQYIDSVVKGLNFFNTTAEFLTYIKSKSNYDIVAIFEVRNVVPGAYIEPSILTKTKVEPVKNIQNSKTLINELYNENYKSKIKPASFAESFGKKLTQFVNQSVDPKNPTVKIDSERVIDLLSSDQALLIAFLNNKNNQAVIDSITVDALPNILTYIESNIGFTVVNEEEAEEEEEEEAKEEEAKEEEAKAEEEEEDIDYEEYLRELEQERLEREENEEEDSNENDENENDENENENENENNESVTKSVKVNNKKSVPVPATKPANKTPVTATKTATPVPATKTTTATATPVTATKTTAPVTATKPANKTATPVTATKTANKTANKANKTNKKTNKSVPLEPAKTASKPATTTRKLGKNSGTAKRTFNNYND
jgi:hypothetical protein